ncbi:AraC family transcriptional regulator ligand-binding domain-containing protein [Shimia sp. SDUM112013]|uniref:AraC family transcriptional regulator n=1 Tax=Shimia sp. SDUM112013 TaxID=3136160 RepID=UPI0032EC0FB5
MGTYIRASALSGLDDIALRRGLDLDALLEKHDIDPAVFTAHEAEVDFESACALLEDCAQKWDMPDLGVHLSRYHALETLGVVALVTRMETSVRTAVREIIRNLYLHTNGVVVALNEPEGEGPAEMIWALRGSRGDKRQFRESGLCNSRTILECIVGHKVKFYEACVVHAAPTGRDSLALELGCPVRYGTEINRLVFDARVLDEPLKRTDVAFHPIIRRYLAEISAEKGQSFSDRVRLEVFRQLSLGLVSQDRVAAALRLQPRTLQRRLKAENTSFRDILDEERRKRALALVQQTDLPLSEVALAVAYSDQTAFNQAFKRWFDRSPLKVRRGVPLLPGSA